MHTDRPDSIIHSVAPIRICDLGGWTDTWFARYGQVLNIAVYPAVEVQVQVWPRDDGSRPRITIHADNYGESWCPPAGKEGFGRHALVEASVAYAHVPDDVGVEISIFSECPGGCSTGTSAAVGVALLAALDRLTPGRKSAQAIAAAAQRVETELLRQQSGIQDQIAAAHGGVSFIEMTEYPSATVIPVKLSPVVESELESRLALIFVGQTHSSSETHEMVIAGLEDAGPEAPELVPLRRTPGQGRAALEAGDLDSFGEIMTANTEAQRALNAALIGPRHQEIIDIAASHGAAGWKVNGAGGAGGSVTLLGGADRRAHRRMIDAVLSASSRYRNIPVRICHGGVQSWTVRNAKIIE
ncbi:MAG: hypothetical protein SGI92_19895 [Bryobacteraceae bacterium]|nr:hypothetical protein [Bryobacteraceae bacterium]